MTYGHTRFKAVFLVFSICVFFHVWKCFINILLLACPPTEITLHCTSDYSQSLTVVPVLYLALLTL